MSAQIVLRGLLCLGLAVAAAFLLVAPTAFVSAATNYPGITAVEQCGDVESKIYAMGAGMMHQFQPILVSNDRVTRANSQERCAVIEWDTQMPAATSVIFSELGAASLNVNSAARPFFWYPRGTTQNNSGMGSHTAILKDLEPGKTYSYRLVSRAHPSAIPQISEEKFFTMPGGQQVQISTPPIVLTATTSPATPPSGTVPSIPAVTNPPPIAPVVTTPTQRGSVVPAAVVEAEVLPEGEESPEIVAAATAASNALDSDILAESTFPMRIKRAFSFSLPRIDASRLDFSPGLGLFARDRYIVPSIFLILILFLLQQLLLPAVGINLAVQRPLSFWMFGVVALAVLAALLGFIYITIVMLVLFLILLAWYLFKTANEDTGGDSPPSATPLGTPENPKTI